MSNRTTIALSVSPAVDAALDRLAARSRRARSAVVAELVLAAESALDPEESPPACAPSPAPAVH